jgi:hypothetical protein
MQGSNYILTRGLIAKAQTLEDQIERKGNRVVLGGDCSLVFFLCNGSAIKGRDVLSIECSAPRHYCRPLQRRSASGLIKAGWKATSTGGKNGTETKEEPNINREKTESKTGRKQSKTEEEEPRKTPEKKTKKQSYTQRTRKKRQHIHQQGLSLPLLYPYNKKNKRRPKNWHPQ